MNKVMKKIVSLVMTISIVLFNFIPFISIGEVHSLNYGDYATIEFGGGATSITEVSGANTVTITYPHGSVTINGTGLYAINSKNDNNNYEVYGLGDVEIIASPNQDYTADLRENGNLLGSNTKTYHELTKYDHKIIDADFNEVSSVGNTTANITVSAGSGTYTMHRTNPETGQSFDEEIEYDDMIDFYINNTMWDPNSSTISYNSSPEAQTVNFKFETLWNGRYYDNIVINGVSYNVSNYLNFDDRTAWLNANKGSQTITFEIPNVTKADSYNIVAKHGENNGTRYLATFLWTADPSQEYQIERDPDGEPILDGNGKYIYILDGNGNKILGHDYIGHSKLEFVKAVYTVGDDTYTVTSDQINDNLIDNGRFNSYRSPDGYLSYGVTNDVDYDDGSLTLPGDAEVTMRVVPDYGYQVTSVNGGNDFTTTENGVSEFTVVLSEGTAGYFQATVEKVDNTVSPISTKVKDGDIILGNNAATDIKNGTVVLSVEDIELESDKIKDFEKEASEAGDYTITNYLDINLDKVLYRGTADNVWSEQIHHLTDKALITLQLEDGIDANNIVIVHNIDDGDEFEIIEIESYDPETNTITFYTDSFSNYAIATKNTSSDTAINTDNSKNNQTNINNNPYTHDSILMWISIFAISLIGLIIGSLMFKKVSSK